MGILGKLMGSKKAVVTLIGLALEVVIAAGLMPLDEAAKAKVMEAIMVICGGYVVGQGVADHGKEAKKVEKGQA